MNKVTNVVVELGPRLIMVGKEALDMGLQAEGVVIQKKPSYLLLSRLTPEEKTFLLGERDYYYRGWKGKRVELNAMATDQLISWLEGRLEVLGLQTKVLPPEDVVKNELEATIDSKLEDDIKYLVREAIEELLGDSISYIEMEARRKVGMPKGEGYYEELKQFLDGCPPEYWRDWISDKATQLEEDHIEDNKSLVSDFLSQRLNKGNDDNNHNV